MAATTSRRLVGLARSLRPSRLSELVAAMGSSYKKIWPNHNLGEALRSHINCTAFLSELRRYQARLEAAIARHWACAFAASGLIMLVTGVSVLRSGHEPGSCGETSH